MDESGPCKSSPIVEYFLKKLTFLHSRRILACYWALQGSFCIHFSHATAESFYCAGLSIGISK